MRQPGWRTVAQVRRAASNRLGLVAFQTDKQLFDFFPCPGCFAQKSQAGFDAGILLKAANIDFPSQGFPSIVLDQLRQDGFQGQAVQGVFR